MEPKWLANVSVPWSTSSQRFERGSFLYLSGQNKTSSGCLTAKITVGYEVFREATSCGEYVIASVSGAMSK